MSAGADREIKAFVYPVSTPHEQLPLAAKLNSAHGWQLTEQDKESTAKAMYRYGHTYEKIAETRAGGKAKVSKWLARTVKDDKERRNRKIFDLWLAGHTQEEIAKAVDEPVGTIGRLIASDDFLPSVLENQTKKAAAEHSTDFEVPLYNVWIVGRKRPQGQRPAVVIWLGLRNRQMPARGLQAWRFRHRLTARVRHRRRFPCRYHTEVLSSRPRIGLVRLIPLIGMLPAWGLASMAEAIAQHWV